MICGIIEALPDIISEKHRRRREKPQLCAQKIYGESSSAVYRICVRKRRDGSEWENCEQWLAPFRGRFLIAHGVDAPRQVRAMAFSSTSRYDRVLAQAAMDLLDGAMPRVLGVYDEGVGLLPFLPSFLSHCGSVTVYTRRREPWRRSGERLYRETGAVVTLADSPESLRRTDGCAVSFGCAKKMTVRQPFLSLEMQKYAIGIAALSFGDGCPVPDGVDPAAFAALRAECAGVKGECSFRVTRYSFGGRPLSPSSARALFLGTARL